MSEDFLIQDEKVLQVRRSDDAAMKKEAELQRHLAVEWLRQHKDIRPTTSVSDAVAMQIIQKYGPEMDPYRVGKMTPQEYGRYLRIIRSEYPELYTAPTERRYFNGI